MMSAHVLEPSANLPYFGGKSLSFLVSFKDSTQYNL